MWPNWSSGHRGLFLLFLLLISLLSVGAAQVDRNQKLKDPALCKVNGEERRLLSCDLSTRFRPTRRPQIPPTKHGHDPSVPVKFPSQPSRIGHPYFPPKKKRHDPSAPAKFPNQPSKIRRGSPFYPKPYRRPREPNQEGGDVKPSGKQVLLKAIVYTIVIVLTGFVGILEVLAIFHSLGWLFLPFLVYLYSGSFLNMFQFSSIQDYDDFLLAMFNPCLSNCITTPGLSQNFLQPLGSYPYGHPYSPYGPYGGPAGGCGPGLFSGVGRFGGPELYGGYGSCCSPGLFRTTGRYGDPYIDELILRNVLPPPTPNFLDPSVLAPNIGANPALLGQGYLPPQGIPLSPFLHDGRYAPGLFGNPISPQNYNLPPPTPVNANPNLYHPNLTCGQGDTNLLSSFFNYLCRRNTPTDTSTGLATQTRNNNNEVPCFMSCSPPRYTPLRRPRSPPTAYIDPRRNNAEIYEVCSRSSLSN